MNNVRETWILLTSSLVVFLLVFSFKLPVIYNSALLAFCLATTYWIARKEIPLLDFGVSLITLPYVVLIFVVLVHVGLSETGDYSRIDSLVVNLAVFLIVFASLSCVKYHSLSSGNRLLDVSNVLFLAFFIQSLIILTSAINPEFKNLVRYFQIPYDRDYSVKFGGIRGLALSGAQFFPLSAAFAVVQPIICYSIINSNRNRYLKSFGFICIAAAGITAGRTSLIGTLFSLVFFLYAFFRYREFRQFGLKLILMFGGISIFTFGFGGNIGNDFSILIERYLKFAFEFVYNFKDKGTLSTSSTDVLYSMYWSVEPYRLLFGYGEYKTQFGSTFMGTDGGYMRNILLFGLNGTVLVFLLNCVVFLLIYNQNKELKDSTFFISLLWILTSVLHIKGDVLLHLVSVQTIIFIIFVYTYYEAGYKKYSIS